MSTSSEFELDLDLQLLPAWARQSSTENRYAKFEGESDDRRSRGFGDRRPPGGGRRSPNRPGGDRPARRGPEGEFRRREGGPGGPRRDDGPGGGRFRGRPDERRAPAAPPVPLPEINVNLLPEEKGLESLGRQIKLTGRAYPLFDIAALVLQRPERYHIELTVKKGPEGNPIQPLLVCSLDESVWLTADELAEHILQTQFNTFYQAEKAPAEPPKGTYTFVAQCGMTGTIFGPPNYHDYQTRLRKFHAERFSRMPFEIYKARVKIVKDENVVKQWVEEQSWRTEYVCLNVPEALKLGSREEAVRHFREVHLPNLMRQVDVAILPAGPQRPALSHALHLLVRGAVEEQRRFPLRMATVLSQRFAGQGLQFFKVNKTVTHVCVARPRYLDLESTVVSDGVKRIVEYVQANQKATRKKLIEVLAPSAPSAPAAPVAPPPAPVAPVEGQAAPAAPVAPAAPIPTPEQAALISDLHWLVHQGHLIEFMDGRLEMAKPPKPPAPKPVRAPAPASADVAAAPPEPAATAPAVETVPGASAEPSEPPSPPAAPEETPPQAAPAATEPPPPTA
jgi:hypothetical protein